MRFDVVIFDEASQVRPCDAVNALYRGHAMIVAGDQKQLPPTSFFEQTTDAGDEWVEEAPAEFDSVLDLAKGAGAFRSLSLRWHYRSPPRAPDRVLQPPLLRRRARHVREPDPAGRRPRRRAHRRRRRLPPRHHARQPGRGARRRRARLRARRTRRAQHRRRRLQRGAGVADRGGPAARPAPRRRALQGALRRRPPRVPLRQEPRERPGRRARRDHLLASATAPTSTAS